MHNWVDMVVTGRKFSNDALVVCFRMLTTDEHYISTVNAYAVVTVFYSVEPEHGAWA
jgi:hypothetical protein